MPVTITNKKIIKIIEETTSEIKAINEANEALEKRRYEYENNPELAAINAEQEALNERAKELTKNAKELNKVLNDKYGWGNWHNLNIKDNTFLTREELEEDSEFIKKHYIMANPAIRERAEAGDIQLAERKVMNDPELCEALDNIIADQKAAGKIN